MIGCVAALAAAVLTALAPAAPSRAEPAHGLAMHGDLKYPATFDHFDYVNPSAPRGGRIRVAAIGTFDSFNPFIIMGNVADGMRYSGQSYLYDSLMAPSRDEPFSEYGLLAESIETPPDRSWVAFTLRKEARWHDGKPITVEDVIWSFETLLAKGGPFYRSYYRSVESVTMTGPRTVKFSFEPGDNRELPLILGQLPVLPKHYWEKRVFEATTLEPPLGGGAYEIGDFEAGRYVTYRRRDDYWGKDLPVNKGMFNFDEWRFDYFRDEDVAIEALKGGALDYRAENNSKKWATTYNTADVRAGLLHRELIPNQRNQGVQGFVYNLRRDVFKDRRVREALAFAFDFEWSNKTLFYGQYARTRSYFQNSELAATGLPSPAELEILEPYRGRIPEEVFEKEFQPPVTDGSGNIRGNLRHATQLLKAAGWGIRDGKMTNEKTGALLEFELLLVSPAFERIVLPFKKSLARLGVSASVRTVDVSQYRRRVDTFDFDMIVGGHGQSESPGNEQRDYWSSESAKTVGSSNANGIKDPVIDELVEQVISAPDRKALVIRTRALDRVLQWGHYMILHWHIAADRILYWDRFGRPAITPRAGVVVDAWWIDEKKDAELRESRGAAGGS